ncbi:hypothetical protein V2J09_001777 [Rumex salicifolius]
MGEIKGNVDQLLRDAALKGDVTILRVLIEQDPHLLHTSSKIQPLHISSKLGHLEFTVELLRQNPSLAEELDPADKSSPLHLASRHGHVDVVKALAAKNPCMCLARDAHGMNPAHVAAIKGHVLVLGELIRAVPAVTKERVGGGGRESILHLCVKYNQLEALREVVETAPADYDILAR